MPVKKKAQRVARRLTARAVRKTAAHPADKTAKQQRRKHKGS